MGFEYSFNFLFIELKNHATLICVAGFILFMGWRGYKKGFMLTLLSLGSVLVTLVLDYFLLPFVLTKCESFPELNETLESLSGKIIIGISTIGNENEALKDYLMEETTEDFIKEIIIFTAIFLIMQITLRILIAFAKNIKKFRLIDWADTLCGTVFGLAEGVILVWIFMIIISLFWGNAIVTEIYRQIFANDFLKFLYYVNPALGMLERLLR